MKTKVLGVVIFTLSAIALNSSQALAEPRLAESSVKTGFAQKLRKLLVDGISAKDKRAISTCIAMAFSEDAWVVDLAFSAMYPLPRDSKRRVVGLLMDRMLGPQYNRHSHLTTARMANALELAASIHDARAFLGALVCHLDSKHAPIRKAAHRILRACLDHMKRELGDRAKSSLPDLPENVTAPAALDVVQRRFRAWLRDLSVADAQRGMQEYFKVLEAENEAAEREMDRIIKELIQGRGNVRKKGAEGTQRCCPSRTPHPGRMQRSGDLDGEVMSHDRRMFGAVGDSVIACRGLKSGLNADFFHRSCGTGLRHGRYAARV